MSNLSKEQATELKAKMIAKRDRAFAEYNKCLGAIIALDLVDGTVDIVDDPLEIPDDTPEEETPDGEGT